MTRQVTITQYTINELTGAAKENAIEWYRQNCTDDYYHESDKEGLHEFLATIGFNNVKSQYSGFWSQGDGASFDFNKIDFDKFTSYSEGDFPMYLAIYTDFIAANSETIKQFKRFADRVNIDSQKNGYSTHYCHARTREVVYTVYEGAAKTKLKRGEAISAKLALALDKFCEDIANAYYKELQATYEEITSDSYIIESLENGDYWFNEEGEAA